MSAARSLVGSLLLLVLLGDGSPAQAPSYSTLKRRLVDAFRTENGNARVRALRAFCRCGNPEGVRVLMRFARKSNARLLAARLAFVKAGEAQLAYRKEYGRIAGLVAQKKLGKGSLEKAQAKTKALTDTVRRQSRAITQEEATGFALRQAVGRLVASCQGDDVLTAVRIVRSGFRAASSTESKAEMIQILGWVEHAEAREVLDKVLVSGPNPLRVAVLGSLEERGGSRAVEAARTQLLADTWQVRAAAVRVLRRTGGRAAAEALIEVLERESGRLISDAVAGLRAISGKNFHDNVTLWREWLAKEGDALSPPAERGKRRPKPKVAVKVEDKGRGAAKRPGTRFYGIDTRSKNLIYVLDYSGSMRDALNHTGRPGVGAAGPPNLKGRRKIDRLARELLASLRTLPKDATFNLVLFAEEVTVWKPRMQRATGEKKEEARQWILSRPAGGATNLFGGLERSFGLAGRGSFDKQYRTSADTIFLLSDGNPTAGRVISLPEISREVKAMNALRRVAIHTIGLGKQANARFLGRLARAHDGRFVHVLR